MYIGATLVKEATFDPVHLRNLRLHQLISACEIARKLEALKAIMEVPLTVTQLILVHSSPINIRFKVALEEKPDASPKAIDLDTLKMVKEIGDG